jgi:hypothetical protein
MHPLVNQWGTDFLAGPPADHPPRDPEPKQSGQQQRAGHGEQTAEQVELVWAYSTPA